MKRLFLIRHGKSTWDYSSVKDIDRPLKQKGISDGYKMASELLKNNLKPEWIVSSNGIRALHSAVIFHRVLGLPGARLMVESDLYLATPDEILSIIFGLDDSWDSVMFFGHNPGITEIVNYLSGLNVMNVPTTGLAVLDFNIEKWSEVSRDRIIGEDFVFPRKV